MKYIDADKLIAEIESRMEDCKLPDGRFPTDTSIVRYEELSCLRNFITSLQQERLSLPSNLNEAAREYLREYNESEFGNGGDDWDDDILITFKAGAEWMSGRFVLVGGEPTGWFRANDGSEYATGLDLEEPIKLPVDFYVRKK